MNLTKNEIITATLSALAMIEATRKEDQGAVEALAGTPGAANALLGFSVGLLELAADAMSVSPEKILASVRKDALGHS